MTLFRRKGQDVNLPDHVLMAVSQRWRLNPDCAGVYRFSVNTKCLMSSSIMLPSMGYRKHDEVVNEGLHMTHWKYSKRRMFIPERNSRALSSDPR